MKTAINRIILSYFARYVWEAPNITGNLWADQSGNECVGAFALNPNILGQNHTDTGPASSVLFNASRVSAIYKDSFTVQPEANQTLIIIKT